MKFRKKPIVIDAFQWTGGPEQTDDPEWIVEAIKACLVTFENVGTPNVCLVISTKEGLMRANQGDWIIRGILGEIYPCKPDVFAASYDAVPMSEIEVLYFGCLGQVGHHLNSKRRKIRYGDTPWGQSLDGYFLNPKTNAAGLCKFDQRAGWSAIGFADYSVDTRGNSNSVFIVADAIGAHDLLLLARAQWPEVFSRRGFPDISFNP